MTDCARDFDNIISIERLFNFHKNTSRYTYTDPFTKVTFSNDKIHIKPESNKQDDYVRAIWRIFDETYFKQIGEEDEKVLQYLRKSQNDIIDESIQNNGERNKKEFDFMLQAVFTPKYLRFLRKETNRKLKANQSLLEEIQLHFTFLKNNRSKKGSNAYNNYCKFKELISEMKDEMNGPVFLENLKEIIGKYMKCDFINYENQIESKQEQLISISEKNLEIIDKIQTNIRNQFNNLAQKHKINQINVNNITKIGSYFHLHDSIRQQQQSITLQYLKYQLQQLQKKQLAESMIKILSKVQRDGKKYYEIQFQEALDLPHHLFPENNLNQLNNLRQNSLFLPYYIGVKSRGNYTCQNKPQFDIIQESNRRKLQKLQYFTNFESFNEDDDSFNQMDVCHECKFLYPKASLTICEHQSNKNVKEYSLPALFNPYLYYILRNQPKNNELYQTLQENKSFLNRYSNYKYQNGHYKCLRKYCRTCHKQQYKKCKFCRDVCVCSRCSRNLSIVKLRTIFIMLGGNIEDISFRNIFSIQNDPHKTVKKAQQFPDKIPSLSNKMGLTYKIRLQQLRLLSFMIMKREKHQLELFETQQKLFQSKIKKIISSKKSE